MKVAVCIITYQRPEGLSQLLEAIKRQRFVKNEQPSLSVVVVDNDAAASAVPICQELRSRYPWELRVDVEPHRGIPHARNRAVRCAGGDADWIIFIDDDEVPLEDWIDELLFVQAENAADTVSGPVLPRFTGSVPMWGVRGRFFERRHYEQMQTGQILGYRDVKTNNVLIRASLLRNHPFDERFALTGGTDTLMAITLQQAGAKMVWASDAVVYEWVPASRARLGWILQRAYRNGNMTRVFDLSFMSRRRSQVKRILGGGSRVVGGTLLLLPAAVASPILGVAVVVRLLKTIAHGLGMIGGALNLSYDEYQTVHKV